MTPRDMRPVQAAMLAGAAYFAATYAIGFVLGTVRTLALEPAFGAPIATLIEAPAMLAACIIICRFMIQRWQIVMAFAPRAAMGLTALACLLLTEALMSGPIRGWTVVEWLNHFKTTQGAISLAVFLIFAALPLVIARQAHIPR